MASVRNLASAAVAFDGATLLHNLGILLPFGIGLLLSIFFVAKILEVLIKRHEGLTYCAILGLVAASPVVVFLSIGMGTVTVASVIVSLISFAIGFTVALWLSRGDGKEKLEKV